MRLHASSLVRTSYVYYACALSYRGRDLCLHMSAHMCVVPLLPSRNADMPDTTLTFTAVPQDADSGKGARTVGGSGLRAGMRTLRHDAGGGIRLRYAWSGLTQFRPACSRSSGDESGSLPGWHGLAGRESICGGPRKGQNAKLPIKKEPTLPPTCKHVCDRIGSYVSGRDDLNVRPLEPHSSALPGCALCHKLWYYTGINTTICSAFLS